ncbi:MAG TPA: DUF779 domain-containing protein [Gaiellaceae bacterium]|nr:DUF779 domain-containing protein [Gaiellaceae bacterium]
MSSNVTEQVVATDAATAVIRNLTVTFGPLMLFQSGGCCDGSSPICLREGELLIGAEDLLLGEVVGVPFYIDREQFERWNRPRLVLDVSPGPAEGFSLEGLAGVHFTVSSGTSC